MLGLVERLAARLGGEAAGFEQANLGPTLRQAVRQEETGNAAACNAEAASAFPAGRYLLQINVHGLSLPSGRRSAGQAL